MLKPSSYQSKTMLKPIKPSSYQSKSMLKSNSNPCSNHILHSNQAQTNQIGGALVFFCARVTVCLAFCFFGPAVVHFFRAVQLPSCHFRSALSIAHQRPTCQFRHNADPPPAHLVEMDWNGLIPLSKIGQWCRLRASFVHATPLPDF
jgi:hypothetical protein